MDETAVSGTTPEQNDDTPVTGVSTDAIGPETHEAAVTHVAAAGTLGVEVPVVPPVQWVRFVTEKKEGQGQDGPPILHSWTTSEGTRSIIAVFDGMGGAGSTMVPDVDGDGQVPMAYLASRAAARAFTRGFSQMTSTMSPPEITTLLEEAVARELRELLEREGGSPTSRVRGPMIKNYPTTIAAAIIDDVPDGRRVWPMWAGDSRIYALSPDDLLLQQLTTDHTASGESSDGGDAALTRCATPERVDLESVEYMLPAETIIFAATDGCFAYQPTQYLLTALIEEMDRSHTSDEYSNLLARALASVSGDDCAVSMVLPAGASFADTRNLFRPWLRELQDVRHVPRNNRFLTLTNDSTFLRLRQEKRGS
jgi:Protein phosphatase 2C